MSFSFPSSARSAARKARIIWTTAGCRIDYHMLVA
ncbi:hypothetical protein M7I_5726 [Glarea lozoyensis 74030]|uniref:Uncharacterized protein n=1 Tax=Glarea lozoyensis (strain ATCC 74030 / MF5533) TaxID=1104152 RepID=H0ESM8_GLAL7|nr:hypothetical protein M7I_5726 [Glarea lozoyensis 74030]